MPYAGAPAIARQPWGTSAASFVAWATVTGGAKSHVRIDPLPASDAGPTQLHENSSTMSLTPSATVSVWPGPYDVLPVTGPPRPSASADSGTRSQNEARRTWPGSAVVAAGSPGCSAGVEDTSTPTTTTATVTADEAINVREANRPGPGTSKPYSARPSTTLGTVIRFDQVTKTYPGTGKPALEHVSIEVEKGEFVFLVGQSGSGKSTALRLILRETRPTNGRVIVAGKEINRLAGWKVPRLRRQIGTVFQDFRLLQNKTVAENVAFAMQVIGRSRKEIDRTIPETLELVGLEGRAERMPDELSGGEQQRVAIARAFVNRPMILIADEPTGNLDPATSVGIMKLLDRINRTGTTVVMATHDASIVDQMRKRVVELDNGRVVRDQAQGVYGQG